MTLLLVRVTNPKHCSLSPTALADIVKRRVRITDEVGWFDDSHLGVLLPYTRPEGAWHVADDICQQAKMKLGRADCSVCVYPPDWPPDEGAGRGDPDHVFAPRSISGFSIGYSPSPRQDTTGSEECPGVSLLGFTPLPKCSAWQRGLDVFCSLAGLVVLTPLLLAVALLIKLVSPGRVFFKQVRTGQGGRPFEIWKFRTMHSNADTSVHQEHVAGLLRRYRDGDGDRGRPMTKLDKDPRVIPFGTVLRKTCIDELPQLINVLRGDMSLVGPRPPIPYEVREYLSWQRKRLAAVPGMTGLWQVSGKNRLTFDEMVRLDIRYARRQSLWLNVKIMLVTPRAVIQEIKGAPAVPRISTEGI